MIWSFSHHNIFRKCQRQWYYKTIVANWKAKDPFRKEAYRLSKLSTIYAWRGKIVDHVISSVVIPAVRYDHRITLDDACQAAKHIFDTHRQGCFSTYQTKSDNGAEEEFKFGGFLEIEYGLPLTNDMFEKAWQEIDGALSGLFRNEALKNILKSSRLLITQRSLTFPYNGITVKAIPDLIVFQKDRPPIIIDWKVNINPWRDYWLQLAAYAIAVSKCNPHRDWPPGVSKYAPTDITLIEAQLLTGEMRLHLITEEDEWDVHDLIASSSIEMNLAKDYGKSLEAIDFPAAKKANTCQMCSFRLLCWEVST